ncbi:MAG: chorismate-binding protein [Waddliaceae bacterium]
MTTSDVNEFLTCGTIISNQKGGLLIGWGDCKQHTHINPGEELNVYFPDYFFSKRKPWSTYPSARELTIEELILELEQANPCPPASLEWKSRGDAFFSESFNDLQEHFASGRLTKAVPFVFESAEHTMNPASLCHSLLSVLRYANHNRVYLYGFWNQEEGMLGATPEYLFQHHDATVNVLACGGTCERSEVSRLAQDPKQRHEHALVVKGVIESLSPFGNVTQGDIDILTLPTLCHLITPISMRPEHSTDFDSLVHALHPTPAVGAFPKQAGMGWLKNYQTKMDRSRFGAPAGYVWRKTEEASCYVAIRNAQWSQGQIHIGAGCGIVAQSRFDLEWQEIQLKLRSIKDLLSL